MAEDEQDDLEKAGETWPYLAWRMWCAGNRNLSAIARTLQQQQTAGQIDSAPSDSRMVKRALARESKVARAALDQDETDALSEYIAGLEEQFGEADRLMRTGDNDNAKLGGLKVKVDLLEKLASAKGVVTERKGMALAGADGKGPVVVTTPEQVALALARETESPDGSSDTAAGD